MSQIKFNITPLDSLPKHAVKFVKHHHLEAEYEKARAEFANGIEDKGSHLEKIHLDKHISFWSFRLDKANRAYCIMDGDNLNVFAVNHHDYKRVAEELRSAHKFMVGN